MRFFLRFALFGLAALILVSVISAFAAGLTISDTNIDLDSVPVTAEDIKPAACGGVHLSTIVRGSGTIMGTEGNDLVIGSPGADSIDGGGGDDCILGGGGDDVLVGSSGNDVCLGGPGEDSFTECEVESP